METTIQPRRARVKGGLQTVKKIIGLRAVYLRYCYRLGYLPKKNRHKPLSPEAREAWRKIDRTTAQITLIDHAHLHDLGAVKQFIKTTDAEVTLLTDYRESLRGKLRSCRKPEEKAALTVQRDDYTKALAALRRDKKTAEGILSDQPKIRETIQIEEHMRQQNTDPNQHRKREYTR